MGKRVAELYIDPLTARKFTMGLRRASTQINEKSNGVNEFSFVNLVANTLEMRPLLRIKSKEWDVIQPCGSCRHVISMFGNPWIIVSRSKKMKLNELYPLPVK